MGLFNVFPGRKMRVRHNRSRYLLDDGMLTSGCYCNHACSTYDMVGRHGLSRNLQELFEGNRLIVRCILPFNPRIYLTISLFSVYHNLMYSLWLIFSLMYSFRQANASPLREIFKTFDRDHDHGFWDWSYEVQGLGLVVSS